MAKKKVICLSLSDKRRLIEHKPGNLSIRRQCKLLHLNRSNVYYEPVRVSQETLAIMNRIDQIYTDYPFYGSRKITAVLKREGYSMGRERVQRLMRQMAIEAIYAKPKLSARNVEHKIYPYLLSNYKAQQPNQVWSTDITYIRLQEGFIYLVAVIDWYSRYVLSWQLSNSLDVEFCIEALEESLEKGLPYIFNTDQGCQFTSKDFTGILLGKKIKISMDSKGRALDNVFVERLWRSVKYENIFIKDYANVLEARKGINKYFEFYNNIRIHENLNYKTPKEVHYLN